MSPTAMVAISEVVNHNQALVASDIADLLGALGFSYALAAG